MAGDGRTEPPVTTHVDPTLIGRLKRLGFEVTEPSRHHPITPRPAVVDLQAFRVPRRDVLSAPDAHRLRALPIARHQGVLIVAMADPDDETAVKELSALVGMPISPVAAEEGDLLRAIAEHYGDAE